ncbi:MAG: hypothetical protein O3B13_24005 [Planctomycetota bacterium]|nr:hypothetical protein [Planctomycetota bacterium]
MKTTDFARAFGAAIALLAVNLLVAIAVVVFYRFVIEPGHPGEFYDEAAMRIAPWCSHIIGTALFFVVIRFVTARKPDRNGLLFAVVVSLFYAIIDSAMVGFASLVEVEFLLSMMAKLAAAVVGAGVATRTKVHATTTAES